MRMHWVVGVLVAMGAGMSPSEATAEPVFRGLGRVVRLRGAERPGHAVPQVPTWTKKPEANTDPDGVWLPADSYVYLESAYASPAHGAVVQVLGLEAQGWAEEESVRSEPDLRFPNVRVVKDITLRTLGEKPSERVVTPSQRARVVLLPHIKGSESPPQGRCAAVGLLASTELHVLGTHVAEVFEESDVRLACSAGPGDVRVGTWCLERELWRKASGDTAARLRAPPRTEGQLEMLAQAIQGAQSVSLLALSGIRVADGERTRGSERATCEELDILRQHLGRAWQYRLARSGGASRCAFLYDSRRVRIEQELELEVAPVLIDKVDVLERDPHAVLVQFLGAGGAPTERCVFVNLHLSAQTSTDVDRQRHERALGLTLHALWAHRNAGALGGLAQRNVILLGNFNQDLATVPVPGLLAGTDGCAPWARLGCATKAPASRLGFLPAAPPDGPLVLDGLRDAVSHFLLARDPGASGGPCPPAEPFAVQADSTLLTSMRSAYPYAWNISDHIPLWLTIRTGALAPSAP